MITSGSTGRLKTQSAILCFIFLRQPSFQTHQQVFSFRGLIFSSRILICIQRSPPLNCGTVCTKSQQQKKKRPFSLESDNLSCVVSLRKFNNIHDKQHPPKYSWTLSVKTGHAGGVCCSTLYLAMFTLHALMLNLVLFLYWWLLLAPCKNTAEVLNRYY